MASESSVTKYTCAADGHSGARRRESVNQDFLTSDVHYSNARRLSVLHVRKGAPSPNGCKTYRISTGECDQRHVAPHLVRRRGL